MRCQPADQTGNGVMAQRFQKKQLSAFSQDTVNLAQCARELEVMQNRQFQHDVETLVGKFQIMGVHYSEIAWELMPSGGSASDLEAASEILMQVICAGR